MDEDFSLRLTDIGREVAEQTYEKHCFFTRRLIAAGVQARFGLADETMDYLEAYRYGADLLQKLAAAN